MPTNRTRVRHGRRDTFNDVQKLHLICGRYLICHPPSEEFVDEQHRRETWQARRGEILANWDRPGQRPAALWEYDRGLQRAPYPRMWGWPGRIETEAQMVHLLIRRGALAECRFDGLHEIDSEIEVIEAGWRMVIGGWAEDEVPRWFYRRHAKAILAEREAHERKFREEMARPAGRGNGAHP
jgi:hypothetical protein